MEIHTPSNAISAFTPWGCYVANYDNCKNRIEILAKLSEDEYTVLMKELSVLNVFRDCYSVKEMLTESKNDIINYLSGLSIKSIPPDYLVITPCLITANKLLMNYLSFLRTFKDVVSSSISKQYKEELVSLQKYDSKLYDNLFGYRFLTRLRNYAIHREMPLKQINVSSQNGTQITCNKSDLLQFDGWSTVKKEIVGLPDTVNVIPYIDDSEIAILMIYFRILKILEYDIYHLKSHLEKLYSGLNPTLPTIIKTKETIHEIEVEALPVYYLRLFLTELQDYSVYEKRDSK